MGQKTGRLRKVMEGRFLPSVRSLVFSDLFFDGHTD